MLIDRLRPCDGIMWDSQVMCPLLFVLYAYLFFGILLAATGL